MSCGSVIKALELSWMCLLLLSPGLSIASTDPFSVVVPTEPVSALHGSSAVLPCYLSDNKDASSLRVRWYRLGSFNSPVLVYNDEVQESEMDQLYQGRVSLDGDLKIGTVSLRLQSLIAADAGLYVCRVSSETWYNTANVSLKVTAVGFTPVLYLTEAEEGKRNITCQSHGWLPEPAVIWTDSDGKKVDHLRSQEFIKDSDGLITVTSSLITFPSESAWFSCSVGFKNEEMKDSRISPHMPQNNKESGASWFGSFITTLVFLLLLCVSLICGFYLLKTKGLLNRKRRNTAGEDASPEELKQLDPKYSTVLNNSEVPDVGSDAGPDTDADVGADADPNADADVGAGADPNVFTDLIQLEQQRVTITVDQVETPDFFRVTHSGTRISCILRNVKPNKKIFTLCKEEFSSGKHYFKVTVQQRNVINKSSWYVGVASKAAHRVFKIRLAPENDFWVLCYEKTKGVYIENQTDMPQLVDCPRNINDVGVFVDCDNNTVSFYNAVTKSHIHTFTDVKNTTLRPLISPGISDRDAVVLN